MITTRRHFAQAASLALLHPSSNAIAAEMPLIESIEKVVLPAPPVKKGAWFGPRAWMVGKKSLMTVQPITGWDYFGPVQLSTADDFGNTWSEFQAATPFGGVPQEQQRRTAARACEMEQAECVGGLRDKLFSPFLQPRLSVGSDLANQGGSSLRPTVD